MRSGCAALNVRIEHVGAAVRVLAATHRAVAEDFTGDHFHVEIGQQLLGYAVYAGEPDFAYLVFCVVPLAVPFTPVGVIESLRDVLVEVGLARVDVCGERRTVPLDPLGYRHERLEIRPFAERRAERAEPVVVHDGVLLSGFATPPSGRGADHLSTTPLELVEVIGVYPLAVQVAPVVSGEAPDPHTRGAAGCGRHRSVSPCRGWLRRARGRSPDPPHAERASIEGAGGPHAAVV